MIKNGRYKKCEVCGNDFYVIPAQESRGRGMACSIGCAAKLRLGKTSKKKGMEYPHLQRAEVKICRTCGNDFRAIGDHNGRFGGTSKRDQIYCSHTCYVKGNRISQFEDQVYNYLIEQNIQVLRQIKKGRWSFDFGVKDTNILIEADGSYWHSKLDIQFRDKRKEDWCQLNNYELYRIDELQFYKNNKSASQVIVDRMRKLDPALVIKRNGKTEG